MTVSTLPITYGPSWPPRFPTELIIPILAAAAELVRNRYGIVQNAGRYAFNPPSASMKQTMVSVRFPCVSGAIAIAAAPIKIGRTGVPPALLRAVGIPTDEKLSRQCHDCRQRREPRELRIFQVVPAVENAREKEHHAVAARHGAKVCKRKRQHLRVTQPLPEGHVRLGLGVGARELSLERVAFLGPSATARHAADPAA